MSDLKSLFGLYLETKVVDDDTKNPFGSSSGSTCLCASYNKDKLETYANTLNAAEQIKVKLLSYCVVSIFSVKPLRFIC